MSLNFSAVPGLIALVILVAVFAAISRQHTRERVRLWLSGWVLVLLRAGVQFIHSSGPSGIRLNMAFSLCALELAGTAFIISVAPNAITGARQAVLAAVLAVPMVMYTLAMVGGVSSATFYIGCVVVGCAGLLLLLWRWRRKTDAYIFVMTAALLASAALVVWRIRAGNLEEGVQVFLTSMNLFAAGMFWFSLRRTSAGVLTTVFGFVSWAASFPAALLLHFFAAGTGLDTEVWDIPKYLVAIGMIVTLLEEQIIESEHLAYHDALTGLPNRRLLQDRLLQAMAHAGRTGRKIAVLLLDLDDFKAVNDTFGHRIGDGVLQEAAARLSARLRSADTLARTGGDEFTVISEVSDTQGAQTLVWALEAALLMPLRVERRTVRLGVSIGFALYPDDATDPSDLCALADRAMYAAKHGNRALRATQSNRAN